MVVSGLVGKTDSEPVATYNYQDLAAGTGYITYYAGTASTSQLLTIMKYYSDAVCANLAMGVDRDYSVTIQKTITIAGITVISVPVYDFGDGSPTNLTVSIRKNATELCTGTSTNFTGADGYYLLATLLTVPSTQFKKGDVLTLRVVQNGDAGSSIYIGEDPMARTAGWDVTGAVPSLFQVPIPMRIYT